MIRDLLPWIWFHLFVFVMLGIDLLVHKNSISIKQAISWSGFWILLALFFNGYIYYARGWTDALNFFTGYLIEKSLSVDNLFVFVLIFKYFQTPPQAMHKILFWGVFGAMLMRGLFIALGIVLISQFHWLIYLMGIFLIYTGIKLWSEEEKEINPENNPVIKFLYRILPVTKSYEGNKFLVKKEAKTYATPLLVTLVTIETVDVIFALDSIPAILAITFDPFIVYTSNIFAILGLRSLYFVLSHIMEAFHHLHYGLAFILVFIGAKMLASGFMPIPTWFALGVVFAALFLSVAASILYPAKDSGSSHSCR